ncbi:MAG: hypothetical protein AAGF12_33020 [Myxococcota bacterium]
MTRCALALPLSLLAILATLPACPDDRRTGFGGISDGGGESAAPDGGWLDASNADSSVTDGGSVDEDTGTADGGVGDPGSGDSGTSEDAGSGDAGSGDAGSGDAGAGDASLDASSGDAGAGDSGAGGDATTDAGPPLRGCISGATGTHALRFRWDGSTSGGRASVVYETNTLPDTSRWRVTAASSSIGYRPVFRDPFLGKGGLELSGTVFIDVELSTGGLGSVSDATLAVYGRSYNTTTSGSFTWQTFDGTGASPRGGVSNVAPYRWYRADATAALPAGNNGTLLRIRAGPPSGALIVHRVEVCFTAR